MYTMIRFWSPGIRMVSIIDSFNPFHLFKEKILFHHCCKQSVSFSDLLHIVQNSDFSDCLAPRDSILQQLLTPFWGQRGTLLLGRHVNSTIYLHHPHDTDLLGIRKVTHYISEGEDWGFDAYGCIKVRPKDLSDTPEKGKGITLFTGSHNEVNTQLCNGNHLVTKLEATVCTPKNPDLLGYIWRGLHSNCILVSNSIFTKPRLTSNLVLWFPKLWVYRHMLPHPTYLHFTHFPCLWAIFYEGILIKHLVVYSPLLHKASPYSQCGHIK